ncbi:MAG: ATP-binding protein [Rhodothermales bacterium]
MSRLAEITPPETNATTLRVLILEDNPGDAEIMRYTLEQAGFSVCIQHVDTRDAFLDSLHPDLDVILSDHNLPDLNALQALNLMKDQDLDIPFIIVSGTIREELAVEAIKQGAADYLFKDRLARLAPAVVRALDEKQQRIQRKRTEATLRESHHMLQAFMETLPVGVFVLNADGTPFFANKPAQEILGKGIIGDASKEELAEVYDAVLAGTDTPYPTERMPIVRALAGERATVDDMEIQRPDRRIPLQVWGSPVWDSEGHIQFAIAAFADITERKQAQLELERYASSLEDQAKQLACTVHELERAKKEAEAATRQWQQATERLKENQAQLVHSEKMASLGQLAAGVAHEINNPIGFVTSNLGTLAEYTEIFTQLLDDYQILTEHLSAAQQAAHQDVLDRIRERREEEDLDFIREDVDALLAESLNGLHRVKEIVQGLKSFARLDATDMQIADINEGIEATLKIVWNELKYTVDVETRLGVLPRIRCYPGQLNQVFMNLLVNAAHAIEGHGEIIIETEATAAEVLVRIADTGRGIPAENMAKLFNPFFTTKPVGAGTGLGLSISHGIIKKHGGRIEVESQVGCGTTFTIHLPITEVDDA